MLFSRVVAMISGLVVLAGCTVPDSANPATTVPTSSSNAPSRTTTPVTVTPPATSSSTATTAVTSTASPSPTGEPTVTRPPLPAGLTPWGPVTADHLRQAVEQVAELTDADLAASVLMVSSADAVGTDLVADLHVAGVILMGNRGIVAGTTGGTPQEVLAVTTALQDQASGQPLLIATDQEYGIVARLRYGFTEFPGAGELGALDPEVATRLTEEFARAAADEMRAVGIDVDFAPVADLLPTDGDSAIGSRSYGSDPERAGALVAAAVRGYQSGGMVATAKHFPGLGPIAADTHETLPAQPHDCDQWNGLDRVPFAAAVDAGVGMVMTGHVTVPALGVDEPASLSHTVVTDLLSGDGADGCHGLGYPGLRVTDALEMAPVVERHDSGSAALAAISAGQDLLLMPDDPRAAVDGLVGALADGSLDRTRLEQAAIKVTALRIALAEQDRPDLSVVGSPEHRELATER